MSKKTEKSKLDFSIALKEFAKNLGVQIEKEGEWTMRGLIDIFQNIYPLSTDTKLISKILELHIFPYFVNFATENNFELELATHQNYYPDMTFISKDDENIKFAVDLKTTYRDEMYPDFCNGFTLGSHGEYFQSRESKKNIQYPYKDYSGHFIIGIIYSRTKENIDEKKKYKMNELDKIPSVAKNFLFFAAEKWKIASDKGGSGNTANIGSIEYIPDIINENGIFAKASESLFDEYWMSYGKLKTTDNSGKTRNITTLSGFLTYRNMDASLENKKIERKMIKKSKKSNDDETDKETIHVPPLKIQGIKTKLVPIIKENIKIDNKTVWVEPFMGSGVVGFNVAPKKAIFSDTNPYIIQFYNDIKNGVITSTSVRTFLEDEGKKLEKGDDKYYYKVRDRFNKEHKSLDFLFLNRACFNGMMRFNGDGNFNVPYCHKSKRFSKAYITKIVNQVKYIEEQLKTKDWTFVCQSFEKTIKQTKKYKNVFIYCDPPYIGRNTDYYDNWNEEQELALKNALVSSGKNFMVSTWDYNQYRCNDYIKTVWNFCNKLNIEHFYHVGAKEENRIPMVEALLINYNK